MRLQAAIQGDLQALLKAELRGAEREADLTRGHRRQ
jgi:hypothetical protein